MKQHELAMLLSTELNAFAKRLLDELGLPSKPLDPLNGWANNVWLGPAHVVRLSSGRFRDAFAHEREVLESLSDEVPYARVVSYGRIGTREWLVQERAPGRLLLQTWPEMSPAQRQSATVQLGAALRALHQTSYPPALSNPWLDDALTPEGPIENAYHAAPSHYERLLSAAASVPGIAPKFLDEVNEFIAIRTDAFAEDQAVLVHGDAHFANLMWDGERLTAILDFEGAQPAARDLELDTLLRFAREPELYRPPQMPIGPTRSMMADFPEWLYQSYPELFAHPRLLERLQVYEALWHLVQLLHFPPGEGTHDPYGHLKSLLQDNDRWTRW